MLNLYAVSVKGRPTQIRMFEMYASDSAYEAHLQTPYFLKYKTGTRGMARWLTLLETAPVSLGACGLYQWRIDPAHLRPGPNTFTLSTTRTRRPADVQPGADPRLLGLLVRGWTFRPDA